MRRAWDFLLRGVRPLLGPGFGERLRERANARRRERTAPRMLWGYRCASGEWRRRTRMSDTALVEHPDRVFLDDNVFVGHHAILDGTGTLHVGAGSQVSARAYLLTHSSHVAVRLYGEHYQEVPEEEKRGFGAEPVRVGRYVFIGAGAIVLPGVTIGDGALVAAGSVVRADVPPFAVVAGVPARVVGDAREQDRPYLDDPQIAAWYGEWQDASG